jgi:Mrp family chromosome partitioning ATPase/capsular polysaccharide biosynthesis protein
MEMRAENSPRPPLAFIGYQPLEEPTPPSALPNSPRRAFQHIRRRIALVAVVTAVGALLSLGASQIIKPAYTATALLAVNDTDAGSGGGASDVAVDTQIAMLQSQEFLKRAYNAVSHDERLNATVPRVIDLERRLKVIQVLKSPLIAVAFSAKSPTDAADIANKIARVFVEDPFLQGAESVDDASRGLSHQIAVLEAALRRVESKEPDGKSLSANDDPSLEASNLRDQIAGLKVSQSLGQLRDERRRETLAMSPPVQLVALAQPPARPSSMNPKMIIIPATVASTIFSLALALVLGQLGQRIYFLSDLVESFSFPCAGAVPRRRGRGIAARNTLSRQSIGYSRAIEAVVTRTLLMQRVQGRAILITSSGCDGGGSEFALNFVSCAARMGRRVLLIDLDMTRLSGHAARKRPATAGPGALDVLAGRSPASDAIVRHPQIDCDHLSAAGDGNVDLLPVLAGGRMKQILTELKPIYDCVVLRGPPVNGVSETQLIAAAVDTTILVVRSGVSAFSEVKDALGALALSMSLGSFGPASSNLFTVLTDAPKRNLPPPFRNKRFAKRVDRSLRADSSAIRPGPNETPEGKGDRSRHDYAECRLTPSCG